MTRTRNRQFAGAAQAPDRAVLQNAEQFGLRADRHLADFVQQYGAVLGQLETARVSLHGAGEGALFMTE